MENKKNTVLLTVIAVATLLVAVVGATFAYFSAQGGSGSSANVTVVTGTAASANLGTFSAINIYADQENFAQGKGDQVGTSTGSVSYTAVGATDKYTPTEEERTFCYSATLNVTANTFVVSSTNTTGAAELTFSAKKGSTVLIDEMDITTTKTDVKIPTAKDGSTYIHKITPAAGDTEADAWVLTVTLHNLDVDQNDNTGKAFTGAVKFDQVDCNTGAVINPGE